MTEGCILYNAVNIYESVSLDTKYNLALEEHFVEIVKERELIFFLWQSLNSIVIGKHQNPYKECDIEKINNDKVALCRRMSGGGAVYQDKGNLNFSFISNKMLYDYDKNIELITSVLKDFGIPAQKGGRNDILVHGKKISGNAFFYKMDKVCHHGTLLVDTNLNKLSSYLKPSNLKLNTNSVNSVSSRVVNLKELSKEITVESLKRKIVDNISTIYPVMRYQVIDESIFYPKEKIIKYNTRVWNYGESPDFMMEQEERFDWGIISLNYQISNGQISECRIYTDAVAEEDFQLLQNRLSGLQFCTDLMVNTVCDVIVDNIIKRDIVSLIRRL